MKLNIWVLGVLAVSTVSFAADNTGSDQQSSQVMTENQEAGTRGGMTTPDQGMTQDSSMHDSNSSAMSSEKSAFGPHAILVTTELHSALNEVQGLKSQVKSMPTVNKDFMDHTKVYNKEIKEDMNLVQTHRGHIMNQAQRFPKVAQNDDFKALDPALMDVQKQYQSWQSKINDRSYWQNKDQALADLDNLEKRFNTAIDKAKAFNSSLDLKVDVS